MLRNLCCVACFVVWGKMASSVLSCGLAVALLGMTMLTLPNGKAEPHVKSEESSCQGAFDLYFVLDK